MIPTSTWNKWQSLRTSVCLPVKCVCVSGGGGNTYTYLLSHQTVPRITCKYAPKRLNEVPDTLSLFSRSAVSDSFATPWTGSFLSIGFPRQEHWSELPFPPPGDLPNPGTEPVSLYLLHSQAGSLPVAPPGKDQLVNTCELHLSLKLNYPLRCLPTYKVLI